jgi:uncharacterized membrane protein (UPF0127 family)
MQGNDRAPAQTARTRSGAGRHPSRACAAVIAALAALLAACSRQPEVVIHTGAGRTVRVRVELALTPEQQERGLMFRRELARDSGMLFVFPESEIHSFWMKNTPLPLDMIFIGEDAHIVGIVDHTVPFSTTSRLVPHPSRYVLEVNAGFSAEHGVKAGDRVDLPPLPITGAD